MAQALNTLCSGAAEGSKSGAKGVVQKSPKSAPDLTEHSRDLLRLIRQAQEAERRRVARELHDSVNQLLSSVQFRLQLMEERLAARDESSWRETLKAKALLEKAIQEVRRISHNLRPSELDDLGLEAALRSLCREFSDRTGIAVNVSVADLPRAIGGEIELNLYRIVQEALTNVEKHAGAGKVEVSLAVKGSFLEASIRDDGRGFSPAQVLAKSKKPGMGLVDMRERAAFLEGTCTWQSAPRQGTQILVQVPLPTPEQPPANTHEKRKTEKNPFAAGR